MTHLTDDIRDRVRGCAVGAAVGDALGMPLEFKPKRPADDLVTEMQDGRLPAGTFTDDTEMALAVAQSLLEWRPLNPYDLAERFVDWLETGPEDVGVHTRKVLQRIDKKTPWDVAADSVQQEKPDSAGNGSLMRCWPVALAHWDNLDDLVSDSWKQSRVTHPHPDCQTASAFANAMIYHLLRGNSPDAAMTFASSLVRTSDEFWQVINAAPARSREDLANTGWVRHTLESALWGLTNFDSFAESVVQVVNLGSDADTAGAVNGALAGAYHGLSGIPDHWANALRGEWPPGSGKMWDINNLITLADKLAEPEKFGLK